jgi:hypothetical protein
MHRKHTYLAAGAAAALIAAGCGSGGAGAASSAGPGSQRQSTTATTVDKLQSVTTLDADIGAQMRRYLTALAPVHHEVMLANQAARHAKAISSSGDFTAMAADSRQIEAHLARAAAAARRVSPPDGLGPAHAHLVRALLVGRTMAARLTHLYTHIGPSSQQEYRKDVLPLEKRAVRLGDGWFGPAAAAMAAGDVNPPKWIDHLLDWS